MHHSSRDDKNAYKILVGYPYGNRTLPASRINKTSQYKHNLGGSKDRGYVNLLTKNALHKIREFLHRLGDDQDGPILSSNTNSNDFRAPETGSASMHSSLSTRVSSGDVGSG